MKVSVVVPTWNDVDQVGECLRGVFAQDVDFAVEVLVIDSSSTDGTAELARRFPVRVVTIPQSEFNHGDTRNLGALLTGGDLIVYLVQDAYPLRRDWLATLVANFADPAVAGAFCRVLPRENAGPLVRRGVQEDLNFGAVRAERRILDRAAYERLDPLARRVFVNFNDVASCLRRAVWERLPYPRVAFGEDVLWAKAALEAGHVIVFDPAAPVVHSHEYDPKTLRARTAIDGWVNRAYIDRVCIARRRDVPIMTRRAVAADRAFLAAQGIPRRRRTGLLLRSGGYHFLEFLGAWQGGRTADRLRAPVWVPEERLRVLFVLHGFPPESVAGTEVLTLALARALRARGHEVAVFCRSGTPELPEGELQEDVHDGFRVYRVVRHLRHRTFRDTLHDDGVEAAFRAVLARERPDVVHVENLLHLSIALPGLARAAGAAVIATVNDYWFRCLRVQLVRPDGTICAGKPPVLGCAACSAGRTRLIAPLAAVSRPLARPLAALGRRLAARLPRAPRRWFAKRLADVVWLGLRPALLRDALLEADLVLAPSAFMKRKLVEASVPGGRVAVSGYGIEVQGAPAARPAAAGRLRVGFIGSLVRHKGLEVLARAFQRIRDGRVELHVHGDAAGRPEFQETRRRVEGIVTRPGLRFHGPFPPGQLGVVLASLDVLVVPSLWYENAPLVVHEAFQAGVPVVAADAGALQEMVRPGAGGLRFRTGDDADLAAVLLRFVDDPGLGDRLAAAAPPVKSTAANAAEMEMRYRQAIGLARNPRPVIALAGVAFHRVAGVVAVDGDGVRVGPSPGARSYVEYEVEVDRPMELDLVLTLAGDGAEQAGEVRLNGRRVLEITGDPAAAPRRDLIAPVRLRQGTSRLRVQLPPGGANGALLCVAAVAFRRTHAVRS